MDSETASAAIQSAGKGENSALSEKWGDKSVFPIMLEDSEFMPKGLVLNSDERCVDDNASGLPSGLKANASNSDVYSPLKKSNSHIKCNESSNWKQDQKVQKENSSGLKQPPNKNRDLLFSGPSGMSEFLSGKATVDYLKRKEVEKLQSEKKQGSAETSQQVKPSSTDLKYKRVWEQLGVGDRDVEMPRKENNQLTFNLPNENPNDQTKSIPEQKACVHSSELKYQDIWDQMTSYDPSTNGQSSAEPSWSYSGSHMTSLSKCFNRKQLFPKRALKDNLLDKESISGNDRLISDGGSSAAWENASAPELPKPKPAKNKRKNQPKRVRREETVELSEDSNDFDNSFMLAEDVEPISVQPVAQDIEPVSVKPIVQDIEPISVESIAQNIKPVLVQPIDEEHEPTSVQSNAQAPFPVSLFGHNEILVKEEPEEDAVAEKVPKLDISALLDGALPKFRCPECNQSFVGSHILSIHVKGHMIKERKSFTCDICGKIFRRQKYLNKHMKHHENAQSLNHRCQKCGKSFGNASKLRRHERIHRKKPHKCIICLKAFGRRAGLMNHLSTHTDITLFDCGICGSIFKTKDKYDKHMEKGDHTNGRNIEDSNSDSDATIIDEPLAAPSNSGQGEQDENVKVEASVSKEEGADAKQNSDYSAENKTSGNSSDSKQSSVTIKQERKSDVSSDDGSDVSGDDDDGGELEKGETTNTISLFPKIKLKDPGNIKVEEFPDESDDPLSENDDLTKLAWQARGEFTCFYCSAKYFGYDEFQTHIHEHAMTKPFVCTLCGKGLTSNTSLKRHMITHKTERPNTCDVCGKGFIHNCDLEDHKRTHTGERPYICVECGKDFATRNNYNGHRKLHSTVLKHFCPHCSKGYICKRALKRHLLSHTLERPYTCELCPSAFKDACSLRRHIKRHDNIMTHICQFCDRGFSHSTDWRRHVRTHTGERPFRCNICSKGFKQNHHLSDHMRTHTGEKPFSCHYCPQRCATKAALQKHLKRHRRDGDLPLDSQQGDSSSYPGYRETDEVSDQS